MIDSVMAANQKMLSEFAWDARYAVAGADEALTPALVIYPEIVDRNIAATLRLLFFWPPPKESVPEAGEA